MVTLGSFVQGRGTLRLNLAQLVPSRLIIQGDSGSGKSHFMRLLAERTHGLIQQVIIDTEDEFGSLREKHDYVLVGGENGDCPVSTREAPLLARRLLETNVSAIINIYDMRAMPRKQGEDGENRLDFVAAFFNALLEMPKNLWRPMLVFLDELQVYAPQDGKDVPSAMAIANFGAQARKRGFCPVYATPNIAGVDKRAIRGFRNYAIGSAALDTDNKRAGAYLGFEHEGRADLKNGMDPGQFYFLGPAFNTRVPIKVQVARCATTHPEPGRPAPPVPAPRAKLKKILSEFKGLAKEAAAELKTVEQLKARIKDLESGVGARNDGRWQELQRRYDEVKKMKVKIKKVPLFTPRQQAKFDQIEKRVRKMTDLVAETQQFAANVAKELELLRTHVAAVNKAATEQEPATSASSALFPERAQDKGWSIDDPVGVTAGGFGKNFPVEVGGDKSGTSPAVLKGKKPDAILGMVKLYHPYVLPRATLGALVGYTSAKSPSYTNMLSALRSNGLLEYAAGGGIQSTPQGLARAASFRSAHEVFQDQGGHLAFWLNQGTIEPKDRELLRTLWAKRDVMSRADLGAAVGYTNPKTPSFTNRLSRLRSFGLIEYVSGGGVTLSDFLLNGWRFAR